MKRRIVLVAAIVLVIAAPLMATVPTDAEIDTLIEGYIAEGEGLSASAIAERLENEGVKGRPRSE